MTTPTSYTPGMCNIGPAERRMRRRMGIASAVVAVALFAVLVAADAPTIWRLLIFIPATGAAAGLLQDAFRFCAAFGLKGIYNVLNSAGVTDSVELEEYRKKDVRKALQIVLLSVAAGCAVTAVAFFI